jgi:hypothetical protein
MPLSSPYSKNFNIAYILVIERRKLIYMNFKYVSVSQHPKKFHEKPPIDSDSLEIEQDMLGFCMLSCITLS